MVHEKEDEIRMKGEKGEEEGGRGELTGSSIKSEAFPKVSFLVRHFHPHLPLLTIGHPHSRILRSLSSSKIL